MQTELMLPSTRGVRPTDLLELAEAAERDGLFGLACPELAGLEAFAMLGAVAARTSTLRLSTSIVAVPTRSPALLSMATQTLGALSQGRFVLGIGAGSPMVAAFHQRAFNRPFTELKSLVRSVMAVGRGERLEESGGFRLAGLAPQPVQVHVAAISDDSLRFAGVVADGVVLSLLSGVRAVAESAVVARDARVAADNRADFEVVAIQYAYAGSEPEAAQLAFRREIAPYFSVPQYRRVALTLAAAEEIDVVGRAFVAGGRDAAAPLVPQSVVDAILLSGSASEFAARFADLAEAGADTVRVVPVTLQTGDANDSRAILDILAKVASSY